MLDTRVLASIFGSADIREVQMNTRIIQAIILAVSAIFFFTGSVLGAPIDEQAGELLSSGAVAAASISDQSIELFQYQRGMDVFFMLMLVAFLMLFIKRYEWGVALATLLVFAVSWPLYLIVHSEMFGLAINIEAAIQAAFAAITLVIAIGVFLGHISTIHYILAAALFVPAYMLNEWFMFDYLEGVADAGGSILVHVFAAYWGWGIAIGLWNKRVADEPMKTTVHSVSFVWLASMLLLVLWPSFVTALLPPEEVVPAMINCFLAMSASILTTYLVSYGLQRKIDPLVYTYAILAGGVAIGATVNLVTPVTAWTVGAIGGIVSTLSFIYLDPWLHRKVGVLDTMGVHNLHGTPGIFGGLAAIVVAGAPASQAVAVVGTIVIGLGSGAVSGVVLRAFGRPDIMLDDAEAFPMEEARSADPDMVSPQSILAATAASGTLARETP